ncbi:MAG: MaoC family dehydratase [Caulobacterales bacterium]
MAGAALLYFEDLEPGQVFVLGSRTVSKEEIIAFATDFDPQPFHLDEEAGAKSFLGGLCASGWHTCAMVHRLNCDNFMNKIHSLGAPGLDELRWIRPVFPGDTISGTSKLIDLRPSNSRPDVGLMHIQTDVSNQAGDPVLRMKAWAMIARRPGG